MYMTGHKESPSLGVIEQDVDHHLTDAPAIAINSTNMMSHLSWCLCSAPSTASQPICNVTRMFAPPLSIMSQGSQKQFNGILSLPAGP